MYLCDYLVAYGRCSLRSPLFPSTFLFLSSSLVPGNNHLALTVCTTFQSGNIYMYVYTRYQVLVDIPVCRVLGVWLLCPSFPVHLLSMCVPVWLFHVSPFRELCSILPFAHFRCCFRSSRFTL